jgi:hypothetical protein
MPQTMLILLLTMCAFSDTLGCAYLVVAAADAAERSSSSSSCSLLLLLRRRRLRYFSAFSPQTHPRFSETSMNSTMISNSRPRFSSVTTQRISPSPSAKLKSLSATFAYPRCRIFRAWQSPGAISTPRTARSSTFARFPNTSEVQIDGAI